MPELAYSFRKAPRGTPGLKSPSEDKSLSKVHMRSLHMHCGGIWDLTPAYLEQKLAVDVLLHYPS